MILWSSKCLQRALSTKQLSSWSSKSSNSIVFLLVTCLPTKPRQERYLAKLLNLSLCVFCLLTLHLDCWCYLSFWKILNFRSRRKLGQFRFLNTLQYHGEFIFLISYILANSRSTCPLPQFSHLGNLYPSSTTGHCDVFSLSNLEVFFIWIWVGNKIIKIWRFFYHLFQQLNKQFSIMFLKMFSIFFPLQLVL